MFQGDASQATGRVVYEEYNGRFKNSSEPDEGGMKPTIEYLDFVMWIAVVIIFFLKCSSGFSLALLNKSIC